MTKLMTVDDVAAYLGKPRSWVYGNWRREQIRSGSLGTHTTSGITSGASLVSYLWDQQEATTETERGGATFAPWWWKRNGRRC
ncbi:hypothetical protein [Streptomyces sp. NBRC 110028]|uniref:hypothetical protein n=1 Tax=Streptomyces sp. NBRC 110028 TaxID=1621260 RepID=UPI000AC940C4|nr:hypothetical protein [Streptomyces sp. NBRC 110028]